jgi:hypothetical protein
MLYGQRRICCLYADTSVTAVENSSESLIICYVSLRTIISPPLFDIFFQQHALSINALWPTYNANSHE